jgi:hypothetical protein
VAAETHDSGEPLVEAAKLAVQEQSQVALAMKKRVGLRKAREERLEQTGGQGRKH